ncbi:MAG TPA: sigma factor-like helix-turn-helix DNA-binding protein [Candidatus Nanopelagicaceae bacterium]|nr:sigma factor-like helix-turn-helix DNA-binding protein [Candidatus Nanopelagicaceae bacterium]
MEITSRELSGSLATLLATLPDEERAILTLHYVRSCSVAEIAVLLSVPPRAVLAVLDTAKCRLLGALGMD